MGYKFESVTASYRKEHYTNDFLTKGKYTRYKKLLNTRDYSLNKERFKSKNINIWESDGIIDKTRAKKSGWRYYSLSEIIWLELILILKKYKLDKSVLQNIKNKLSEDSSLDEHCRLPLIDFYCYQSVVLKNKIFFVCDFNGRFNFLNKSQKSEIEKGNTYMSLLTVDFKLMLNEILKKNKLYLNDSNTGKQITETNVH